MGLIGGFIVLALLTFALALWMIRLPTLDLARDDEQAARKLDLWFNKLHASKLPKFNGVVLVRRGNETLIRKGYGLDSQGRELTPDSPLRLASVSKQFTAVGILTLVHEGRLDLDAQLSKYMPNCQFGDATVRSLLDHTSGIPDVIYDLADKEDVLTLEKTESLICEGEVKVGARDFSYSNTGYLLAARLIERVTGESFEAYMHHAVFKPLGMDHSRVWNLVSKRPFPERAGGFDGNLSHHPALEPTKLDGVAGDGGVFSTLNDLENWDRFWSDDRLIPTELKQLALTAREGDYGLGWVRDGDIAWHNGAWLGSSTLIRRNLRTGDLTVVLDNSKSPHFDGVTSKLEDFLGQ